MQRYATLLYRFEATYATVQSTRYPRDDTFSGYDMQTALLSSRTVVADDLEFVAVTVKIVERYTAS